MSKPTAVYVFGTCLVDLIYPQAGLSAMRLIAREGVRVVFPQDQTCCGQPAYNSGFREEARRVAQAQLDAFPQDLPVVVPSAACAGMLKAQYPALFAQTPDAGRAQALAARVVELSDFLVRVLDLRPQDLGPPLKVVVHNSCSARRELRVAPVTLELLGRLANLEVVEPDHAYECCGFGGTFAVRQPEISAAMAGDKARAIAATGAQILVGQDCGCLMNLAGTLARQGNRMAVKHLAELLWERTAGEGQGADPVEATP